MWISSPGSESASTSRGMSALRCKARKAAGVVHPRKGASTASSEDRRGQPEGTSPQATDIAPTTRRGVVSPQAAPDVVRSLLDRGETCYQLGELVAEDGVTLT